MSTLTQARLVPLSYRYLSTTTWRHETCGKITPGHHINQIRNTLNSTNVKSPPLCANNEFSSMQNISQNCNQTNRNTPEARRLSEPRRYSASLCGYHNRVEQLYTRQNHFHFDRQLTRDTDINRQHSSLRQHQHHFLSDQKSFHPLASFAKLNSVLDLMQSPSNSTIERHQWHKERDSRQHQNHKSRHYSNSAPSRSYFAIVGILGLFGKTNGDIEEERGMLSDEQKMKKMKPIELKIARGVLSMCDQDYTKANVLFHEALHMAQDDQDEKQEEMILNLIAANFFESGDLEHAEKLFIDLIKRLISNGVAPTAPAILELSLKLASIYSKSVETHEKALKGFKFVINSLMQNLDDILIGLETLDTQDLSEERRGELALLGWSYDWFAKHLLTINDYNAAVHMLQRAYQISEKVLGPLHDQTLILLNDVGTTLAMNDAPEEGRTYIKRAVEGAIKSQSKELASFYVNLGLVNLKLKELHEAKRYCEYSIELAKKNREDYNSLEVIELSRTCLEGVERLLEVDRK